METITTRQEKFEVVDNVRMVTIRGVRYEILDERECLNKKNDRTILELKRPKGKRIYHAARFKNGGVTQAHAIGYVRS